MAKRLTGSIRQIDTITRLGGDEFVILLEHLPNEESVPILIRKITQALKAPYIIHKHKLHIGVSIGSAIYPCHGTDAKSLINYADQAMYVVKKANKLVQ